MKNKFKVQVTRPKLWEPFSARFVVSCHCGFVLVNTMTRGKASVYVVEVTEMACPNCGLDHQKMIDIVSESIEAFAKRDACLAQSN